MRNLMIFAAVMVGLGTIMAQMADKMTATTPRFASAASQRPPPRTRRARPAAAASASRAMPAAIS